MTYNSTLLIIIMNFLCPRIHNLPIFDIVLILRMFTKLEALEQFQWAVLRLELSSPAWSSLLPPTSCVQRSSPWRCITNLSLRPPPETTLDLTSRTCQLRTSREDMSPLTPRTSLPPESRTSPLRSLS